MKIKIITVGKLKNPAFQSLEQDFLKQLKKYARIETVVVKEGWMPDERSDGVLIALDERGNEFTSHSFSEFLEKQKDLGEHLTFIIGGPFGLSQELLAKADLRMSLSPMTLLHEMAYIILLEQIYRGFAISAGSGYQK